MINIPAKVTTIISCCLLILGLSSCSDLMDTDSEFVEKVEDNRLQESTEALYSVMGIIYKMQAIADRTVLLGELRGDLTITTPAASSDLKAIVDFRVDTQNKYNQISDYYAIINNCNYYLKNVNTDVLKDGVKIFEYESVVVKAFRAWTYLQMALIYNRVPLITEPLLTEEEAREAMNCNYVGLTDICHYFIDDLKDYVDTKLPDYAGEVGPTSYFIPVRVLLGDLCLWSGRYEEAAQYYHDYLSLRTAPVRTGGGLDDAGRPKVGTYWSDANTQEFRSIVMAMNYSGSDEAKFVIPMENNEFYGIRSELDNIFNSTSENLQFAQVIPTARMRELSSASNYCAVISNLGMQDTIYAPKENLFNSDFIGDLRFGANYSKRIVNNGRFARTSNEIQSIWKISSYRVTFYRTNMIYLRYAEALNRAGYPQSAFAILKYGLYSDIVAKQIDEEERTAAGELITFDSDLFDANNTQGVHSRGSGRADCDTLYVLPQPTEAKATRADTVAYQIPLVEDLIIYEMALEGAFEGYRYYDLMRVALRRNDPAYLADPISRREGTPNEALRSKLMDKANWYLPLPE